MSIQTKPMIWDAQISQTLDKGNQIKKVRVIYEKKNFCVKLFKVKDKNDTNRANKVIKYLERESKALEELKHKHIIELIKSFKNDVYTRRNLKGQCPTSYIVLENQTNYSLRYYIMAMQNMNDQIRIPIAKKYLIQLIETLQHIHNLNWSHRDINLENLGLDNKFELKIGGFGLSHQGNVNKPIKYTEELGFYKSFHAPEIIKKNEYYGHKVDTFAAGVCFFNFCFGKQPFTYANILNDQQYKNLQNDRKAFWNNLEESFCSNSIYFSDNNEIQELKDLIQNMLHDDPAKRWNTNEILDCGFLRRKDNVKVNEQTIGQQFNQYYNSATQKSSDKNNYGINFLQENKEHNESNIPQDFKDSVQDINTEFNQEIKHNAELEEFQEYDRIGLEQNQFFLVLEEKDVTPVLIYVLRKIQDEQTKLNQEKPKISKNTKGKVKVNYVLVKQTKETPKEVSVSTNVQFVQKDDEENKSYFKISLVRNEGDYMDFLKVLQKFTDCLDTLPMRSSI